MIGICPSFIVEMKKKIKEPTKAVKPFFFWGGGGGGSRFCFCARKIDVGFYENLPRRCICSCICYRLKLSSGRFLKKWVKINQTRSI